MSQQTDFNRSVVEEFRANGGKVSGQLAHTTLLLLTTTGARSGQPRTTPLGFITDGDRIVLFASNLGSPKHPDWYHNLAAHPEVTVEIGTERFQAIASTLEGAERERIWASTVAQFPFITDHQAKTTRQIPLVVLSRQSQ